MSISLKSNADGTTGAIQLNGVDVLSVGTSGNVGIGTSSPGYKITVDSGALGTTSGDYLSALQLRATSSNGDTLDFKKIRTSNGGNWETAAWRLQQRVDVTDMAYMQFNGTGLGFGLSFGTNNTEHMRIDSSGNLLVGTTTVPNVALGQAGFSVSPTVLVFSSNTNGGNPLSYWRTQSGNSYVSSFWNGNSNVGHISVTTATTSYNTASDYRLKHDIAPMTGALAKVQALKPVTYKWNADDSAGEGFIAHELAEVMPQCVTGEKDAVDKDGKPQYQGIDTSFLVATLTAAIQELKAINDAQAQTITALTARVTALEGAQIV